MSLKIQKYDTRKDKIKQPTLAASGDIPRINTSTIFSGKTGSGKSLCLVNLLKREDFLGGWFDQIFLISPTGLSDDIQGHLDIPKENVFTDLTKGMENITNILNMNRMMIEAVGADKAPKLAIIYDDCVGDRKIMNHHMFIKSFIACRHFNATTFICTQSFTAVPRRCRLQCTNVIIFGCSMDEQKALAETYTPAKYNKKEFCELINFATTEPYSFMFINLSQPQETRYRQTFETILRLTR